MVVAAQSTEACMSDALRSDNLKADPTVSRAFDRPAMLRLACHVQGAATAEVAIYVHRPRRAYPSTGYAVMRAPSGPARLPAGSGGLRALGRGDLELEAKPPDLPGRCHRPSHRT